MADKASDILARLGDMNEHELRRLLALELTRKPLGLVWERNAIEHDRAINQNAVLPRLDLESSHLPGDASTGNLIIEGDNFDSLRLLSATHRGKIKAIYIDPPYNTGEKDWVYCDSYVSKQDRWRHSKWLEFIYQRVLIARDLLTPDGVMFVSINDENRARLDLLLEEAMPGRRIGSFVWKSRAGGNDNKGAFLSTNHEHVLVYGNPAFSFTGEEKAYSIYTHEEGGRLFYLGDLAKAHDRRERPNTYYPLEDTKTGIRYPCNPNRVWAYASENRIPSGTKLRGKTMEQMIRDGEVWFPVEQRVEVFPDLESLKEAIDRDDVPFSGSTPLLSEDMPDLDAWVGVRIGYGRPRLKKFKDTLKNERSPVSSWLSPRNESGGIDPSLNMPVVGGTDEGSRRLRSLVGKNAFPYPKPPSLITALLSQATSENDIVLDFFAGSGTTGEVVLRLNQQDGGHRRFILCSSTEATSKRPEHNVCRDVCAERLRAVSEEMKTEDGLARSFAYLTLDLVEEADLDFEGEPEHAHALVALRESRRIYPPTPDDDILVAGQDKAAAILVCRNVTPEVLARLAKWPVERLIVYSSRPDTVRTHLEEYRTIESFPLDDAFRRGQQVPHAAEEEIA